MTRRAVFQQIVLTAPKFLSAHPILPPPASAAPNRYTLNGHHQNLTPGMSAVNGTCGILSHLIIRFLIGDTNLKSSQVQSLANDIRFVICDETPRLSVQNREFHAMHRKSGAMGQCRQLFGTTTIISMHYGNSMISIRQNAERSSNERISIYSAIDLRGVVDAGMAIRQETRMRETCT